MGNAESTQDHYKVLGVQPDASGNRIDKAFRSAALKWDPESRSPGDIDKAYRTLRNPTTRSAYNASRGSGRNDNGNGLFFYTCIFVVGGYVTYRLWRSGKLEEISKDVTKKIGTIIDWAKVKDSDAASAFKTQLASFDAFVDTTVNRLTSKLKDSDAASALQSQLASSASSVASATKDGLSKVGEASLAGIKTIGTIINSATEVKDSDAASALGSQLASSASSVASACKDGLSKVSKWFQN